MRNEALSPPQANELSQNRQRYRHTGEDSGDRTKYAVVERDDAGVAATKLIALQLSAIQTLTDQIGHFTTKDRLRNGNSNAATEDRLTSTNLLTVRAIQNRTRCRRRRKCSKP